MALLGEQLEGRQVALYLHEAGFTDERLITAVAICHAESDYFTEAINTDNPDGSMDYGLMQINSVHFGETVAGRTISEQSLYDPVFNCLVAHRLYATRSYSFTDWASFTSGAYRQFQENAIKAVANMWRERYGLPLK